MLHRLMTLTVIMVLIVLGLGTAHAERATFKDPNERGLHFDIARAGQARDASRDRLIHSFTNFERWTAKGLDSIRVRIRFNTDSDQRFERILILRKGRQGLVAVMKKQGGGNKLGNASVARPNRRTAILSFSRSLLSARKIRYYKWNMIVDDLTTETACELASGRHCVERVPDSGTFVHSISRS